MPRALYVGGLDEAVTLDLLRAAFIPFGVLKDVQLPLDREGKGRGFGFVEFEDEQDAEAAIGNMDGAELFGRGIRVNFARGGGGGRAVWADAEKWWGSLKESAGEEGGELQEESAVER